jgi:hypothetical protein
MTSSRTLSHTGEQTTEASVSSRHATTHSYTIQPTISLDEKLLSPLFICFQEQDGKFGPQVEKNLFQCPNVVVHCSTSGKMSKFVGQRIFNSFNFIEIVITVRFLARTRR